MCELRKRGATAVIVCSDAFLHLARAQARVFGVPDLPAVVIPHPLTGIALEEIQERALLALPQLIAIARRQSV